MLPDEILALICQQLGQDRDFSTLYQCALSAKSLADPALRITYQLYEQSPTFNQGDELEILRQRESRGVAAKFADAESLFRKWTVLWRSIILSTVDNRTFKPYCRFIRKLDFRNLETLLSDPKFVNIRDHRHVRKDFYAGLEEFKFIKNTARYVEVDKFATLQAIGEALTSKSVLLEEMDGDLNAGLLPKWISRSPRLQALVLLEGESLSRKAGSAIRERVLQFRSLTIKEWRSAQADRVFAEFLEEIAPNTIEYLNIISFNNIGPHSFKAMGTQCTSLQELKLANLSTEAVENLNCLQGCTSLRLLELEDNFGSVRLEELHNDVFVEVISWLSSCRFLRELTLKRFWDAPSILARVLTSSSVNLAKLSVEGYVVRRQEAAAFHTALSEQPGLESLWLKGDGDDTTPDDLNIMVQSLCTLQNLRELMLKDVSNEFDESHITNLALHLPLLEEFETSGGEVGSDILPLLANMKHLKSLTLYALTQFRGDEILDFVSTLDPVTQTGFGLFLMAADAEFNLTEPEQDIIRDVIRDRLNGRFDFAVWREADLTDSEDE